MTSVLSKQSKKIINSLHAGSSFCCLLLTLFKSHFFQEILTGTLSDCQMVLIQIRTDSMSVRVWVQTVCKGYQQTIKVAINKERVYHPKFIVSNQMEVPISILVVR